MVRQPSDWLGGDWLGSAALSIVNEPVSTAGEADGLAGLTGGSHGWDGPAGLTGGPHAGTDLPG